MKRYMLRKQKGSAVLISLLLLSCIMLWSINAWRTTALMVDVSLQRQDYEACFYATQGICNWLVIFLTKNFDSLYHNKALLKLTTIALPECPYAHGKYNFEASVQLLERSAILITLRGFNATNTCQLQLELQQHIHATDNKKEKIYRLAKWTNL